MENFWRHILENLPLVAAEGGACTEVEADHILYSFDGESRLHDEALRLAQDLLCHAGVLDPNRLADGYWRFVSYPARLFACSLISLLSNEDEFFPCGFWAPDMNDSIAEQHRVLHSIETLRSGTSGNFPIRRTFVAWGIIKRGRHFILKRRENTEGDPDNKLHGGFGFPGGRINMNDMNDTKSRAGAAPDETVLNFLYGIPRPINKDESASVERALERTLIRELREELGLIDTKHYVFSRSDCVIPPQTFIHGANAHHCVTECHMTHFDISLTAEGDAFLASVVKQEDLFTFEEILSPRSEERKAFFDASCKPLIKYLGDMPDSAGSLQIKSSDFAGDASKPKRKDEPLSVILPLSPGEPMTIGDKEIPISDSMHVELLLLLGFCARPSCKPRILSDAITEKNWGWVQLNDELRRLAYDINSNAQQVCGVKPLDVHGFLCRLRADGENIFFSPKLFRAELRNDELTLIRGSLDYRGLFHIDAESRTAALSSSNLWHLQNIEKSKYDNLRKLTTKSNLLLDDFARELGLYKLYAALDDSVSKENQRFIFSIHVN
ncbi:MAG: hypothetical protein LBT23_06265 [Synergistaceae bacterium]|nr:hypothetical protein [Synergistaceae bacterium]